MSENEEATASGGFFVGEVSITLRRGRPVLFSAGTVLLVVFMLGVGEFLVERLFLFIRQVWVEIFDRFAGLLCLFLHDLGALFHQLEAFDRSFRLALLGALRDAFACTFVPFGHRLFKVFPLVLLVFGQLQRLL